MKKIVDDFLVRREAVGYGLEAVGKADGKGYFPQTASEIAEQEYAANLEQYLNKWRDRDESWRTLTVEEFQMWKRYCDILKLADENPTVGDAWSKLVVVYNLAKK